MIRSILSVVLGLLLFSGCVTSKVGYVEQVNTLDYARYNRAGVFLTESNSVSFDYEPVGSISVVVLTGYSKTTKVISKVDSNDGIYGDRNYTETKTKANELIYATPVKVLDVAVAELTKLRANGIINLHIKRVVENGQPV